LDSHPVQNTSVAPDGTPPTAAPADVLQDGSFDSPSRDQNLMAIERRTQLYRRQGTMRKRHGFRPAVDPLEARLALSTGTADVVQEGDFQGQFGDQTTPDGPGTTGETDESPTTGVGQAATGTAAAVPQQPRASAVTSRAVAATPRTVAATSRAVAATPRASSVTRTAVALAPRAVAVTRTAVAFTPRAVGMIRR
jgi:hypothetical protein